MLIQIQSFQHFPRRDILVLFGLFVFAFLLRFIHLFSLDLNFDEIAMILQIDGSYKDIWNTCKLDNFPPLYPWLLKTWSFIFPGDNSLRLFSALIGSLTPPAAFIFGCILVNRKSGWLLGIASAISVPLIDYSQLIRWYTLVPLISCISIMCFIRGIQTNHWKYWLICSLANLIGFYSYVLMAFLITIEFIILFILLIAKKYNLLRAIIAHIPTFVLIFLWMAVLIVRYQHVAETFWLDSISHKYIVGLWFFLGTGGDFGNSYLLAIILNIPFAIGIILGIKNILKNRIFSLLLFIFIGIISMIFIISLIGPTLFFKKYFVFLVPIYLCLVFIGWEAHSKKVVRWSGIALTLICLFTGLLYYNLYYYEYHWDYGFALSGSKTYPNDGHALSKTSQLIRAKIQEDEIVIHYSSPEKRSFTYFPIIHYNERSLNEYIYSKDPIPTHFGGQYLMPGEWISDLNGAKADYSGLWVVTLDSAEALFDTTYFSGRLRGWLWVSDENLPRELYELGCVGIDTFRFGRITTIYFRQNDKGILKQ